MFILISTSIYCLFYVLNNHPLFNKFWEIFGYTTIGKLISCPFCFSFWVGFPVSILMAIFVNPIYVFISPFSSVINSIIDKIIKL